MVIFRVSEHSYSISTSLRTIFTLNKNVFRSFRDPGHRPDKIFDPPSDPGRVRTNRAKFVRTPASSPGPGFYRDTQGSSMQPWKKPCDR